MFTSNNATQNLLDVDRSGFFMHIIVLTCQKGHSNCVTLIRFIISIAAK